MHLTDGIKELKRQVESEGYSRSKLADLSGVPLPTISIILNGKSPRIPRLDTLKKLIDVLPIEKQKIVWKTINEDENDQEIIDPLFSNHKVSDVIQREMYKKGYTFETFTKMCSGIQKQHLYRIIYGFDKLTQEDREIISRFLGIKPQILKYDEEKSEDDNDGLTEEELNHLFDETENSKLECKFNSDFLHIYHSLEVYQELNKGLFREELRLLSDFIVDCNRK